MICYAFLHLYADTDQLSSSQAQSSKITLSLCNKTTVSFKSMRIVIWLPSKTFRKRVAFVASISVSANR